MFTILLPNLWKLLLQGREVLDRVGLAIRDHDVRLPVDDRLYEVSDALARVLVVAVGIDENVSTELQGPDHAVVERPTEPHVPRVVDDVLDAECPGDLDGPITRAVIDDQKLEFVHPLDVPGHLLEDEGERGLLVEARDLDDYLHAGSPVKEPMP